MDASLAAALEGLKAVGQAAAESIVASSSASADDAGRADRVAFCAAADVETACVSVLGKDAEEEEAIAPAAASKRGGGGSGGGGFLSRLHEGLEGLGIGRGHSSTEAAAASAAAAAAASAAASALPPPPAPTAAS